SSSKPNFLATASRTRCPSGTTSLPMPSPGIAAMRCFICLSLPTGCGAIPYSTLRRDREATMAHDHHHEHHHDHDPHDPHPAPLTETQLRVKALESLLTEKGLVDPKALDELIDTYETKVGPRNGAKVVARAWVDPAYKRRLLAEGTAAIAEFGFTGRQGEN